MIKLKSTVLFSVLLILATYHVSMAQIDTLINQTDTWEYYNDINAPINDWHYKMVNGAKWKSGKSIITNEDGQRETGYFRKKLKISRIDSLKHYGINFSYRDSVIFYLDGVEIFRSDLVNKDSLQIKKNRFMLLESTSMSLGDHILAAEVHNVDNNDILSFELVMFGNYEDEKTLIGHRDLWYYYDSIMPDDEAWFSKHNPKWKMGYSEFGYGEGDESTVIGFGDSVDLKNTVSYFLKEFVTIKPEDYIGYLINMKVDDGAVVYLNGKEIWRANMPTGAVNDNTFAEFKKTGGKETRFETYVINPHLLINGANTIAVSVHQSDRRSSDCSFSMELRRIENIELIHEILKNENAKLDERLIDIRHQMLIRDKELELKVKDQELQLNKLYINITIGIILMLLASSIIFWYTLRLRNRVMLKNNSILKDELLGKNQELINMSLGQLNSNRLLLDLESDLSNADRNKDSTEIVNQLKNKISIHSIQDKEWENLQFHFENVHSDYFSKLIQEFPSLNSTELRLCGFIRLQLTTKEIARILSVDPRSVQTSRYRLKKKLNIPNETGLIQFLFKYN